MSSAVLAKSRWAKLFGGKANGPALTAPDRLLLAVCLIVPLVGLALFFLYPLAIIAWRSVTLSDGSVGLGNYGAILRSPGIVTATVNSLWISGLTTLLCLTLGFAIAYGLQRTRMGGKGFISGAITLPLLAPSLVQGLGLLFLLGRNGLVHKWTGWDINIYGPWGLLLANSLYALPQAVLILQAALRTSDARYYDAAEVMGASRWRQFMDITLPNARFGLLSAAFVVFTVTITDFGNAAVIGGDFSVLATEIYSQVVGQMNIGMGAVIGMVLLIPTLVAVYLERIAAQKQSGGSSESAIPVTPTWVPRRDLPLSALVHTVALAVVGVVVTVVFASFVKLWPYNFTMTLKNYNITLSGGYDPLFTSLLVSVEAAAIGALVLFGLAFAMKRLPSIASKAVYLFAVLPVGVPGLVMGLSYILAFNVPDSVIGMLYGSSLLIAFCNLYHYHSQGFLAMVTGMRAVPPALEESVTCLGGGLWSVLRDATLPFMAATLAAVFFFLFMRSMVTLSAVIFLFTPQVSVASVTVMRLDEAGFVSQAAAFSTIIMLTVITALAAMKLATRVLGRLSRA